MQEDEDMETPITSKVPSMKLKDKSEILVADTMESTLEASIEEKITPKLEMPIATRLQPSIAYLIKAPQKQVARTRSSNKAVRDTENAQMIQERCRQLCLSLFFREHAPVRSLGFTSSLRGEGKSFMALLTADALAQESTDPVTLLECNWEQPCLYKHFGFSSTPGLAEWLRGECNEMDIRHKVYHNLTVIPAGNANGSTLKLLQQLRQMGLLDTFRRTNDLLVVDLPSIVASAYGSLAASLVDSLIIVVRAGVTPDAMIAEACTLLKDLPVNGILLNQVKSRIPRWIRQII